MGLNAPLLPRNLSKELGLKGAVGSDSLYTTRKLYRLSMGWYFTLLHFTTKTCAPWLPILFIKRGIKNVDEEMPLDIFEKTFKRAVSRGVVVWETALDVCYEWGFDPRKIECKNICIWHPADDSWCPPEHGKWIANFFKTKKNCVVNFKQDDLGYNHFTYVTNKFRKPENSMAKALLDGLKKNRSRLQ